MKTAIMKPQLRRVLANSAPSHHPQNPQQIQHFHRSEAVKPAKVRIKVRMTAGIVVLEAAELFARQADAVRADGQAGENHDDQPLVLSSPGGECARQESTKATKSGSSRSFERSQIVRGMGNTRNHRMSRSRA